MNTTFLSEYSFENDSWKIYTLNKDDALKYFNTSNKINISEKELNLTNTDIHINCAYLNFSNKIMYSMIQNESISFLNIYDNNFYDVYNIYFNYKDAPIILYYCNRSDPFVVIQLSSYMDFQYIYYTNKKEIIIISGSTNAMNYYYFPELNNCLKHVNNINNTPLPISIDNKFKKYLFFGFNMNTGHYLWNEVSGLYYFLQNKIYHNKIHGIIIGPYDFFNIEEYLKKNFNFNVLKFNDLFNKCVHNCNINLNNIFPVFLNNFYIDKNIKHMIDGTNITENDINTDIIEISIDIRTNRRYLINQEIFYTKLIQNLLDDYKEKRLNINFLGCFQTNCYIIDNNTDEEFIKQNKMVSNIVENFNKNKTIKFNNLIGQHFVHIRNQTVKSKLFIASSGTSVSNLMNWIYNIKVIGFGPKEAYNWKEIQYNILKNYDVVMCPIEYITTNNGLQDPFDINFDLYYHFFKNELCKLL
jgi:hypothetical protein